MNKKRVTKSPSPHSVAAIASMMVLVVGVGVGAYFVEFRGMGLRAMMAGAQAQELLMLFGGMAVCTLLTQFFVSRAARPSGARDNTRDMIRAILEMDPSDPNATRRLESVPELHELASMIAAEKSSKIEAMQQLQAQGRDLAGLLKGMERSAVSGDPLREEHGNEICNQVARTWNSLLAKRTSAGATENAASASMMSGPGSPEPGMIDLSASLTAPDAPSELFERVERVEESLETLQRMVHQLSSSPAHGSPVTTMRPAFDAYATSSESLFAPEPVDPPAVEHHGPPRDLEFGLDPEETDDSDAIGSPSAFHEWNGAMPSSTDSSPAHVPGPSSAPAPHAFETLPGLETSGRATPVELPGMTDALPMTQHTPTSSATAPGPGMPPTIDDPTGTSGGALDTFASTPSAPSFGTRPSSTPAPVFPPSSISFGAAPARPSTAAEPPVSPALPGLSQPYGSQTPKLADAAATSPFPAGADADVEQEFARHFPHFVGQPVTDGEQIEVTYGPDESQELSLEASEDLGSSTPAFTRPQTPRVQPAPARAPEMASTAPPIAPNPRQFPESEVIDLRSLGAVEFED